MSAKRSSKSNRSIDSIDLTIVICRDVLPAFFDVINEVNVLNSNDTAILEALKRPELGVTLTKIHCWRLAQFTKCVFMDADTLVVKNIDELFEKEELSAVPDSGKLLLLLLLLCSTSSLMLITIGWVDIFNTGVSEHRSNDCRD